MNFLFKKLLLIFSVSAWVNFFIADKIGLEYYPTPKIGGRFQS